MSMMPILPPADPDPPHEGGMPADAQPDVQPEADALADLPDAAVSAEVSDEAAHDQPPPRDFEDLTLAEAFGMLARRPIPTLIALIAVARAPIHTHAPLDVTVPESPSSTPPPARRATVTPIALVETEAQPSEAASEAEPIAYQTPPDVVLASDIPTGVRAARLAVRVVALIAALFGSASLISAPIRGDTDYIQNGLIPVLLAMAIWLIGETLPLWSRVRRGVARHENSTRVTPYRCDDRMLIPLTVGRAFALAVTIGASYLAYLGSAENQFTGPGVLGWAIALIAGAWTFAPQGWSPLSLIGSALGKLRAARLKVTVPGLLLVGILIGGTALRVVEFGGVPPEMTSDHKEKLLDVANVLNGNSSVFFLNNGGRDALHFYFLAALASVGGLDLDFNLLKLATVIEGVLTIAVVYWMGREVIGRGDRQLGEIVGLLLALLVATSAWHLFLSRLGLRIVLTPLMTALFLGFFARALRHNRRWDFLYAGIVIGVGLYSYQSLRMLPVVAVVGAGLAFFIGARTWRVRLTLVGNMIALVAVAVILFIPLYRFSVDEPEYFWSRTSGRLFGDDLTQEYNEDGILVRRTPTVQERIDAFGANLPNLVTNTRNALLMFHWRGDVAWFHNPPNRPAFDAVSGALLVIGVAAALARAARRGDPVDWLVLPGILVMMLPSILALAFPVENPSHTRISGALPGVYYIMALAGGVIALELRRAAGRVGTVVALGGVTAATVFILLGTSASYFTAYRDSYSQSAHPYSEAGRVLRHFAVTESNGYGNVHMLAYPYWWDHRLLGIEGGALTWDNTILNVGDIPRALRDAIERAPGDVNRLDPNRPILFFVSPDDEAGRAWLMDTFAAVTRETVVSYNLRAYDLIEVPAQGIAGLNAVFVAAGLDPAVGS